MLRLNELKPAKGAKKDAKRIGRGTGSGSGSTTRKRKQWTQGPQWL